VRVSTQVRLWSSPTWNGTLTSSGLHSRTCMTSVLPSKGSSGMAGSLAMMRPSKASPQCVASRSRNRSAGLRELFIGRWRRHVIELPAAKAQQANAASDAAAMSLVFSCVPTLP
jgi:hypothetical protein